MVRRRPRRRPPRRPRRRGARGARRGRPPGARAPPGLPGRRSPGGRPGRSARPPCPGASAALPCASSPRCSSAPISASIASLGTPPGRSSVARPSASSTTVDSTPTRHGPPSSTRSTRVPSPRTTCAARVGEIRPNRLAEGAATGMPAARIRASATGWSGTRRPTVGSPAVTIPGMWSRLRRTSVSGPGQKRAASRATRGSAASAGCTWRGSSAGSARWTISGSNEGRSLAAKTRATASASSALAPSP